MCKRERDRKGEREKESGIFKWGAVCGKLYLRWLKTIQRQTEEMGSKVTTKRATAAVAQQQGGVAGAGAVAGAVGRAVQQWHLKQLGEEFCFIFISWQTETGSCCCKIYRKKKFAGNAKVFHGIYPSPALFLGSYFHGKQLDLKLGAN